MRLILLILIGVLFLAHALALDDATNNDKVIELLDVADQGANHANDGAREARETEEDSETDEDSESDEDSETEEDRHILVFLNHILVR